jgi:iron complex outermembrane receptor protein
LPTRTHGAAAEPNDLTSEVDQLTLEELMKVRISPFDLSVAKDRGYQAFSSITGTRLDTPIRDLPFPLQAFTRPFIEDQQPATIYDVAKYSPSVTYRSNDFNEGNANLAIRGFAVGTTPSSGQVLRDGFQGPPVVEFPNVARLEIVKGPSSFLYGQVAPGGIVNLITKSPQPNLGAAATVRVGAYGAYRFEGDVTGPLWKTLLFRATASFDQDIHYWRPYDAHSFDLAPALAWQPLRWMTLTLKHELYAKREGPQLMQKPGYGRQRGVVPTAQDPDLDGVSVPGLPSDWNSMSNGDFRNSDTSIFSATLDVSLLEHWSARASYVHGKYDIDAVFSGNFGISTAFPFAQGRRFRRQRYTTWNDTFDVGLTGHYDFGAVTARLLLGAQSVDKQFDNFAGQAPNDPAFGPIASPLPNWDLRDPTTWDRSAPSLSSINPTASASASFKDRAIHGGITLAFFDGRLLALAGGRLTEAESRTTNRLTSTMEPEFKTRKVTPQYGLLYALTPGLSLFATYAESFVPVPLVLRVRDVETVPAQPTHGRGVDAGVKATLLEGRITGTATAFQVRNSNIVNDISELDPTTGMQVFTNVQSGEQRCSGVELDAMVSPVENWQTYLSYSYNHARIVEFSGRDAAVLAAGPSAPGYKEVLLFHNAPLQMSAPHLANVWTRYEIASGPYRGLYGAGGVNVVVDQALLPDTPADYHQTYALLNASIGSAWSPRPSLRANLEFYGKNLTNREYRPSQSSRSRPLELGAAFTVRY